MNYIFLFPGQGSQTPRMGWELYRELPECRSIFDQGDPAIVEQLLDPRSQGNVNTEFLQPAISLVNVACLEALRTHGLHPVAVAGHSLGEYSAAYAAGVLSLSSLLRITAKRGELMASSAARNPGGMLAVAGLSSEQLSRILEEASTAGPLCIANRNSDEQVVLSGAKDSIARAAELASHEGARKITQLSVSGAWHSPLMSNTRPEFERELNSIALQDAQVNLYCNVTGEPTRSAEVIRRNLVLQYDATVLWSQTMHNIIEDWPDAEFVEVGPGRVLMGLLLNIDRHRKCHHVDSPSSLAAFLRKAEEA
jgi:[acyl-carrier-protein] S-malonyltransferase